MTPALEQLKALVKEWEKEWEKHHDSTIGTCADELAALIPALEREMHDEVERWCQAAAQAEREACAVPQGPTRKTLKKENA